MVVVTRCFVRQPDQTFLLLKRSTSDRYNAGKWECPGGKLEPGENVIESLRQKVWKETSLLLRLSLPLICTGGSAVNGGSVINSTYIVLFGIGYNIKSGPVGLSAEHDQYAWLNYSQMLDHDLATETRQAAIFLCDRLRE